MKRSTLIWVIIASALLIAGAIIFTGVLVMIKFDFSKLSTVRLETNTYEIVGSFKNISISTIDSDVEFVLSDDGVCRAVCDEPQRMKHAVDVRDDTLFIDVTDERRWYDHIGIFGLRSPKVTVYLPSEEYHSLLISSRTGDTKIPSGFVFRGVDISATTGDVRFFADTAGALDIRVTTGDVRIENVSAASVTLSVSTGDIRASGINCSEDMLIKVTTGEAKLSGVTCKNLSSTGSTGDIELTDVVAFEKFHITRSTGDVEFKRSDAAEIYVKVSTGDVEGTLLTEKIFVTDTSTGSVKVPQTVSGGKCEIKTSTGDIKISIP